MELAFRKLVMPAAWHTTGKVPVMTKRS